VGDRVELKSSGGGSIVMGVVESISMMRTQLRTDRAVPISIPNRAITDMIVSNESHIKTPSASIAVRGPPPPTRRQRQPCGTAAPLLTARSKAWQRSGSQACPSAHHTRLKCTKTGHFRRQPALERPPLGSHGAHTPSSPRAACPAGSPGHGSRARLACWARVRSARPPARRPRASSTR